MPATEGRASCGFTTGMKVYDPGGGCTWSNCGNGTVASGHHYYYGCCCPTPGPWGWVAEETDRRVPFAPERSLVPWSP